MSAKSTVSEKRSSPSGEQGSGILMWRFGERLRAWRVNGGLTQKDVALGVGVSIAIVCEWEDGNRFPSARHIGSLSAFTAIPFCCFLYSGKGWCPCAPARMVQKKQGT